MIVKARQIFQIQMKVWEMKQWIIQILNLSIWFEMKP